MYHIPHLSEHNNRHKYHPHGTDIVVYTDGNCVVTIKNDSKEKGQFYASTVWSCGNDHGVETVQVIDADGNIKSVYP